MTDRLPKTELALLQEEVRRLAAEVEELKAGPPPKRKRPWWKKAPLVYDGPLICGGCKYFVWTKTDFYRMDWCCCITPFDEGRGHNTKACSRFAAANKYLRRVSE